ncbi:MAG: GNAT family N-acetyltransferase [Phycisphaeraceae bacterium]|nr:GNAT family N-acetyltransferase [Phycisphaeraceae bacterium]
MSNHLGVLILYNTPVSEGSFPASEAGVLDEVQAVVRACQILQRPHRAAGITHYSQLSEILAGADETLVFNLVEGFTSFPEQATYVPALCTAFNKACTGNSTPGLLHSLDKWQSKTMLQAAGWPCPEAVCIQPGQRIPQNLFAGPYLVKPLSTDASEGIDSRSVVSHAGRSLNAAVTRVHKQFSQPALVEQYINGRELNVSVIQRQGIAEALPLAEIDFSAFGPDRPRIVGYKAKWQTDTFEYHHTPRVIPAPLPKDLAEDIRVLAVGACRTLGCDDYCRVDLRLDQDLRPFILEVNANPDINPDAGFAAALEAAGIPYQDFVHMTLENAMHRQPPSTYPAPHTAARVGDFSIRYCESKDRLDVLALLAGTHLFRPSEMIIAREILADALRNGPQGHYQSFVAVQNDQVMGWVCFGPTPCTIGTYDLYWIAVDKAAQGCGIGRALMTFVENAICNSQGKRIVVETSGRDAYEPSRKFYHKLGYTPSTEVRDFYDLGDSKVVLLKCL